MAPDEAHGPHAPATPRPGAQLGPYRLERELARGGMGAVHEAVHVKTGARYAVKTLLTVGARIDAEQIERFTREAQAMARIRHPHVGRIHEAALDARTPYIVMDLLTGGTLGDRLTEGPAPWSEAADLILKLALAVDALHAAGVLHRDLKPQNVLFTAEGEPQLVDFGLALADAERQRLTQTGAILGTPTYMAPEQATGGKEVDVRADVYALGALLFTLLSGGPPFKAGSVLATLDRVLNHPPPNLGPEVPPPLAAFCQRALAKRPEDRPQSALAFAEELERATAESERGPLAHQKATKALVALSVLAAVLTLAVVSRLNRSPQVTPPPADPGSQVRAVDPAIADPLTLALITGSLLDLEAGLEVIRADAERAKLPQPLVQHAVRDAFVEALAPRETSTLTPARLAALATLSRAAGLPAEHVASAKRDAWLAVRDGWSTLLQNSRYPAERFGQLRDALSCDPAVPPAAIVPAASRALERLVGEPEALAQAVALQVELNPLDQAAPPGLIQAAAALPYPDFDLLQLGAPVRRLYGHSLFQLEFVQDRLNRLRQSCQPEFRTYLDLARDLPFSFRVHAHSAKTKTLLPRLEALCFPARNKLPLRLRLELAVLRLELLRGLAGADLLTPQRAWLEDARAVRQAMQRVPLCVELLPELLVVEYWALTTFAPKGLSPASFLAPVQEARAAVAAWRALPGPNLMVPTNPTWIHFVLLTEEVRRLVDAGRLDAASQLLTEALAERARVVAANGVATASMREREARYRLGEAQARVLSAQGRLDEALEVDARMIDAEAARFLPSAVELSIALQVRAKRFAQAKTRIQWLASEDRGPEAARGQALLRDARAKE